MLEQVSNNVFSVTFYQEGASRILEDPEGLKEGNAARASEDEDLEESPLHPDFESPLLMALMVME